MTISTPASRNLLITSRMEDWRKLSLLALSLIHISEARLALLQYRCDGLQAELSAIKNSRSYRLGRMLTFLPRKLKGGIRCLEENGLSYTLHRLLEKMGLVGSQKTK